MLSEYGTLTYEDCFGTLYGYRSGDVPDSYLRRLPKLREEDSLEIAEFKESTIHL